MSPTGIASSNSESGLKVDLFSAAQDALTNEAFRALQSAWDEIDGSRRTAVLQLAYITNNPYPVGSKDELERAAGPLTYHAVHERYHAHFRSFVRSEGFYDLFLITLQGDCIYTVFKELDYATNLLSGEWASSGLGKAFRAALAAPNKVHEVEFEPYAPSNGALASFTCTGVRDSAGTPRGVLCVQVPFDVTVQLAADGARLESCVLTIEHVCATALVCAR